MPFKIITLGCKLNSCESAAIAESFLVDGFDRAADGESADVYIVNSCAVTGTAVAKVRHELSRCRRENTEGVTVLCGCFPQSYPEERGLIPTRISLRGTPKRADFPRSCGRLCATG